MTKNFEYYQGEGSDASSAKMSKRAERMIEAFQREHFKSRGQTILNLPNKY